MREQLTRALRCHWRCISTDCFVECLRSSSLAVLFADGLGCGMLRLREWRCFSRGSTVSEKSVLPRSNLSSLFFLLSRVRVKIMSLLKKFPASLSEAGKHPPPQTRFFPVLVLKLRAECISISVPGMHSNELSLLLSLSGPEAPSLYLCLLTGSSHVEIRVCECMRSYAYTAGIQGAGGCTRAATLVRSTSLRLSVSSSPPPLSAHAVRVPCRPLIAVGRVLKETRRKREGDEEEEPSKKGGFLADRSEERPAARAQ